MRNFLKTLFNKGNDQAEEPPVAAGMNVDLEQVGPILRRISALLDEGFSAEEIAAIESKINSMKTDQEIQNLGTCQVKYQGAEASVRVEAEIHVEDDLREVVLLLYSTPELVQLFDNEMMEFTEEMEI